MFFQRYRYTSYIEQRERRRKVFYVFFILPIIVFTVHTIITAYLFSTYRVQAHTMEPTCYAGDVVITSPVYSFYKGFERGSLVVVEPFEKVDHKWFKKLGTKAISFITFQCIHPFKTGGIQAKPFVRRIIGVPGDTIYMDSFIVHIKPKGSQHFLTEFEIMNADYNVKIDSLPENWNTSLPFSGNYPTITLNENEYFVLCDNRIASSDSRLWGPVTAHTQIKSKILMCYWPFAHFAFF